MGQTANGADSSLTHVARVFRLVLETIPWIIGTTDTVHSMQCTVDAKNGGNEADKQFKRFSQVKRLSQTCMQSTVIAEHTQILTLPSTIVCFSVHKAAFNRRQLGGKHLD